jgi:hypothetical protein
MYHVAAVSDQDRERGVSPERVLSEASRSGAPRCTLVFETTEALDVMISQLQQLRSEIR